MNPSTALLEQLDRYRADRPDEASTVDRFESFIRGHDDAFLRSCAPGHVTGSAFVVDGAMERTLLVHHRKLGRWLQPGGHCEPGETALEAAMREAREETGAAAAPWSPGDIFDLDIHDFPARGDAPAHLHYDVRYLLVAADGSGATASEESHAVEWMDFCEAGRRNLEASLARMSAKAGEIRMRAAASMEEHA